MAKMPDSYELYFPEKSVIREKEPGKRSPGVEAILGFLGLLVDGEDLLDPGQGVAPDGLFDLTVLVFGLGLVEHVVELFLGLVALTVSRV